MLEKENIKGQESEPQDRILGQGDTLLIPSVRAFFSTGEQGEGVATFFADEKGLINSITISHTRASEQANAPAFFSVQLHEPLNSKFRVPSSTLTPILPQIAWQLATLEREELRPDRKLLKYSRTHPEPLLSEPRELKSGGFIQFSRDLLPATLREWANGQIPYNCSAVRLDAAGNKVAQLSTSALFLPSGSLFLEATIERFDTRGTVTIEKSYNKVVARSAKAIKMALEDQELLYERFEVDAVKSLCSSPLVGATNVVFRNPGQGFTFLSHRDADLQDWQGKVETPKVGSIMLNRSGAVVSWDFEDPRQRVSLFGAKGDSSPALVFSVKPASRDQPLLSQLVNDLAVKEVGGPLGIVKTLASAEYQLVSSNVPIIELASLTGLFEDLKWFLESEGLRRMPLRPSNFPLRKITESVLDGVCWVGIELDDPNLERRLSSRVFFELWEGGCRTIILQNGGILQNGDPDAVTVDVSKGVARPRGVVELQDFLKMQLRLFREDPILLLGNLLRSGAEISWFSEKPVTECFLARARLLSQLMEADLLDYGQVFCQSNYRELVKQLVDDGKGQPAYPILRKFPTCDVELEWGASGISRIMLLSKSELRRLLPRWFPIRAISSVEVPEALSSDPQKMYQLLSGLVSELQESSYKVPIQRPEGSFLKKYLRRFTEQ